MSDSESENDTSFKRMSSTQCRKLWHELAAVYCKQCKNQYGDGVKFASVVVSLPCEVDTETIPTQDLYLVHFSCLQKTDLINHKRFKSFTEILKGNHVSNNI